MLSSRPRVNFSATQRIKADVRINSRRLNIVLAAAMTFGFRVLFRTLRFKYYLADPQTSPYQPAGSQQYLYSVWHDSMVVPTFIGRQPATVALVGRHRDGSYVSDILNSVGIRSIRGSSSRGGSEAVKQMIADSSNHHIVMTPDGPRGPRREMKSGCAFVASRTGKHVVPTAFTCRRAYYIPGSWTNLMIPYPFTTVHVLSGAPIAIPADASKGELERYTQQIQASMDQLNADADQLAAGTIQQPSTTPQAERRPAA